MRAGLRAVSGSVLTDAICAMIRRVCGGLRNDLMSGVIRAVNGSLLVVLPSIAPVIAADPPGAPALATADTPTTASDSANSDNAPNAENASSEAWTRAMALSDQQRYDEALGVIWKALDRDPANTDLLWLEAGVLGWAGRHDASVARYEALIANHPELADALRMDLATQRLWAGDPRGALRDAESELEKDPANAKAQRLRALALAHSDRYQEAIEAYDALLSESPDDLDLQLDRATVLGWMGKNAQAVEAYTAILETHPRDPRARMGLAQNENWRGNHERAVLLFEELQQEHPGDADVLIGLAYANYWADRPEAARTALAQLPALRRQDRDARQLSALLEFEEAPTLTGGFEASDDSDDLRIETWTLDYRLPLPGRSAFMLFVREDTVRDPISTEDPLRVGAGFEERWRDRWKAAARIFYFDPRSDLSKRFIGDASLSYRPGGRFQYDFGFELEPVLTRISLRRGIRSANSNAAVGWRVADRVTVTASAQYRHYSDGNRGTLSSAGARWELWSRRRNRVALTLGANKLHIARDLENGYYDPKRYIEAGPGAEWTIELPRSATLGMGARAGYQKEQSGSWDPFYKVEAHMRIPLGDVLRLVIQAERGDSSLSAASGFKRTSGAVYLTAGF